MLTLRKVPLATALAFGFMAGSANAQHVTTINRCTVIDTPGAYVVGRVIQARASDLTPLPGFFQFVGCIVVNADFVTLDLGGNTIIGPGTFLSVGVGAVGRKMIKVHSGMVTNFMGGVFLNGSDLTIEHVNASYNTSFGISADGGNGHRVIGNTANRNADVGIEVDCPAVILANMATGNGSTVDISTTGVCTREHNNPFVGDQP